MKKTVLLLLSALVLAACGQKPQNTEYKEAIGVSVLEMGNTGDSLCRTYVGQVESEMEISLSFPLGGRLTELHVRNGQTVRKGTLLARVDDTSARSLHDAAAATLRQAEDGYARMAEVREAGGVSEVRWMQMQTDLEKARQSEISTRKHLEDCSLYAPQDGVVAMDNHTIGESLTPMKPLGKLLDNRHMQVVFSVPEQEISMVKAGEQATATMPSFPGKTLQLRISDKGMQANPMGHTYKVRADITSADGVELLTGQVAKAHLNSTAPDGLIVPSWCVQTMAGGPVVWVVRDGKAYRQPIRLKAYVKNGVLVEDGLSVGDRVITDGYQKLYNGAAVAVVEE